ncbi:MAG: MBL fold metallo-hydrolase [Thermoanaerobaculia bacterium]
MRITMIGHSTVLLESGRSRLLTDPWFGRFGNLAYARTAPPSMQREELRNVDGVLLSHHHFDHTDRRYLRGLDQTVPVFVPDGEGWLMRLKGVRNPIPVRTWEEREIADIRITAVPAVHIARTAGWLLEAENLAVWFAGDTYHRPFVREIAERFRVDVALMPVTTFLIPPTMGERGAVASALDLHPSVIIPIHRGITPRLPLLRGRQSVERFERRLLAAGVDAQVLGLEEGSWWDSESSARALRAG